MREVLVLIIILGLLFEIGEVVVFRLLIYYCNFSFMLLERIMVEL